MEAWMVDGTIQAIVSVLGLLEQEPRQDSVGYSVVETQPQANARASFRCQWCALRATDCEPVKGREGSV